MKGFSESFRVIELQSLRDMYAVTLYKIKILIPDPLQ